MPPLYDFQCVECGKVGEHIACIEERIKDCECGGIMKRLVTTSYHVVPDVDFVTENITGEPVRITSRRQLDGLLKKHGLTQKYGKGWY